MFAKHSPPALRRRDAANGERQGGERSKAKKKGELLARGTGKSGECELERLVTEVSNSPQVKSIANTAATGTNIGNPDNSDSDQLELQEAGEAGTSNANTNRNLNLNPGASKAFEVGSNQTTSEKAKESKADKGTVSKLSDTMYRPFGTRSRSASLSGSEAAICKGGPNGSCGIEVVDSDKAMQCDRCDRCFHCSCQGVPLPTYNIASNHKELMWLCRECKEIIRTIPPGSKLARDEMVTLRVELQAFMQATTEQLEAMKSMLNKQPSADQHHLAEQKKIEDDRKFEELQKVIEAQKASLDDSKAAQLELTNQVKKEQEQLLKLVQNQGRLLESSMKEVKRCRKPTQMWSRASVRR